MATLLLLIRHGLTDTAGKTLSGWSRGVHLNDHGREQAERLVERLAPLPIKAMYSSSLERCVETSAPVASARGLEVERLDSLRDTHYGSWTNRNIAQVRNTKVWARFHASPSDARFPDGETIREVQARAVAEVAAIVDRHPKSVVAVFSHADPIQLVLAHYLGLHVDMYPRIVVSPASVSAVLAGGGMPRVLKVNDTGGLGDLVPPRPRKRGR